MGFLRLTKHHTKAVAVALLLAFPFVPAMAQTAPTPVPSYVSAWVPALVSIPIMGAGINGVLSVSSTYNFVAAIGHGAIITYLRVGAVTIPSATSDVTVQFFKNTTAAGNAITAVYDLNGLTASVSGTIPITGNSTVGTNDIIICQVVTGSSIGSAAGLTASIEAKAVSYSNGTSF